MPQGLSVKSISKERKMKQSFGKISKMTLICVQCRTLVFEHFFFLSLTQGKRDKNGKEGLPSSMTIFCTIMSSGFKILANPWYTDSV